MKPEKSTGLTGFLSGKTGDAARPWKEGTENFGIHFPDTFFVITPVFECSCFLPLSSASSSDGCLPEEQSAYNNHHYRKGTKSCKADQGVDG